MPKEKKVTKGEIWSISLDETTIGHEQQGKRQAVIIANISQVDMTTVIPTTGEEKRAYFAYTHTIKATKENGLDYDSVALIFQIRSISKKRLDEKRGEISGEDMSAIEEQMKIMMGL